MEPGDLIEVKTKDETVKGILMPSNKKTTFIKLDSGYNIGIDNKKIKRWKRFESSRVARIMEWWNVQLDNRVCRSAAYNL